MHGGHSDWRSVWVAHLHWNRKQNFKMKNICSRRLVQSNHRGKKPHFVSLSASIDQSIYEWKYLYIIRMLPWWQHLHINIIIITTCFWFWCSCSSVFQLYSVSRGGFFCSEGNPLSLKEKEGNVWPWYTPSRPCLILKEHFLLCYYLSNKSVRRNPNLERKISLCIPNALAPLRTIQRLKFTWVFTL